MTTWSARGHHLAPEPAGKTPDAPSSTAGFKNSLSKIPSTFLLRADPRGFRDTTLNGKPQPKVRKGLASMFGRARASPPTVTETVAVASQPTSGTKSRSWLRPHVRSVEPENKQRPSCGPDPFGHPGEGAAHIVARPFAVAQPDPTVKALQAERRPTPTTTTDCDRTSDSLESDESWVASLSNYAVPEFELQSTFAQDEPALDIPPRVSSLGTVKRIAELTEAAAPKETLKKDKTMSRVWSILTLKKKRQTFDRTSTQTSSQDITPPPTALGGTPQRVTPAPRLPTLHVTKPSTDLDPVLSSPFVDPNSPFMAAKSWSSASVGTGSSRRSLPQRKSLSGLFGFDIKESLAEFHLASSGKRQSTPRRDQASFDDGTPHSVEVHSRFGNAAFSPAGKEKHLSVLSENQLEPGSDTSPDTAAFYSRFGSSGFNAEGSLQQPDVSIRDMSTATCQLSKIVSHMDPAASPTPLRSIRSAILGSKHVKNATKSPLSANNSPRKRGALSRVFQAESGSPKAGSKSPVTKSPEAKAPSTPPSARIGTKTPVTSMVKKGMRNIFAPSSPASPVPPVPAQKSPLKFGHLPISPAHLSPWGPKSYCSSLSSATSGEVAIELQAPSEATSSNHSLEVYDDRHLKAHPYSLGLPPPPPANRKVDRHAHRRQTSRAQDNTDTDNRQSFDFTGEYARLNTGTQRASFMSALQHAPTAKVDPSPLKQHAPQVPKFDPDDSLEILDSPGDHKHRSPSPFRGQPAFQEFVAQTRSGQRNAPPYALPPPPVGRRYGGGQSHEKSLSDISFASISSLGAPIDIRSDWTNAFEHNFAFVGAPPPLIPLPPLPSFPSFQSMGESEVSFNFNPNQRSESFASFESLNHADISFTHGGPPLSRHPHRRPSHYGRRNVSGGSTTTDSGIGRSDWRSRGISTSSNMSTSSSMASIAHLGRPGLGDRMFERDQGVQLTSIEASPADETWQSQMGGRERHSYASTMEGGYDGSTEGESIFGGPSDTRLEAAAKDFFLKGIRHMSAISLSSEEDTAVKHNPQVGSPTLKGDMAVADLLVPSYIPKHRTGASLPGPFRPREAKHRRRPAPLNFDSQDEETPGLTSACTSTDASSFFSVDMGYKHGGVLGLPAALSIGHSRQKSSVASGVQVQPTIKEEDSLATLRQMPPLPKAYRAPVPQQAQVWEVNDSFELSQEADTSLGRWKREEAEAIAGGKADWADTSIESERSTMGGYRNHDGLNPADLAKPMTQDDIAAFIAKSQAMYKPLEEVQHKPVQRHVRSLGNSRAAVAPYGLPIPPLATRYQNKRASTGDDDMPHSALLAEFARDALPPSQVTSPTATEDASGDDDSCDTSVRSQVTSSARRRALGWGRRRPSDAAEIAISPPPLASATETRFPTERPKMTRSETLPSFICFSAQKPESKVASQRHLKSDVDVEDTDVRTMPANQAPKPQSEPEDEDEALMFTPKKDRSKSTLGARNPTRPTTRPRTAMHVHVDSSGSPLNLNTYQGSVPLVRVLSNGSGDHQSPLRRMAPLKPLQLVNTRTIKPPPTKKSQSKIPLKTQPSTLGTTRPARPAFSHHNPQYGSFGKADRLAAVNMGRSLHV